MSSVTRAPSGRGAYPLTTGIYHFGDCRLEVPTRQLWRAGQPVALRGVVFDLITHLVGTQPRVSSHEALVEHVWRRAGVSRGVIAKAVMEARRAIGDADSQPTMIVSVHGLGYRFGAPVSAGVDPGPGPHMDLDGLASQVSSAIGRAEHALETGDHAMAQMAAERALALADDSGLSRLRIVAMQISALVAGHTGQLERMSRLATAALSLARAERQADLVASSQVELAHLHMLQGNSLVALELLKQVQEPMLSQGPSRSRMRYETLMFHAFADLQQFADARAWCRRVQATGLMLGDEFVLCRECLAEVYLLLCEGLWWAVEGHGERAREASARALEASESAGAMPCLAHSSDMRLIWLGNHGLALLLNDELEPARHFIDAFEEELAKWPSPHSLRVQGWRAAQHGHMGMWLARSHRFTEAFEEVEAGVALAAERNLQPGLALLYRHAIDISLRAGDHEKAFGWLRRLHAIERRFASDQAARLIAMLRVEADTLHLQEELAQAQARALELERQNTALVQRICELDIDSEVDAQGFAKPTWVGKWWFEEHARARCRDVPLCLLALKVENHAQLAAWLPEEALANVFTTIRRRLVTIEGLRSPAVRWSSSAVLVATQGVGERRAAVLVAKLMESLDSVDWALLTPGEHRPLFSCCCVDSAEYDSLSAALVVLGLVAD